MEQKFLEPVQAQEIAEALFKAPAVGVLIYREKILYANDYFCQLTGYSREELEHLSLLDFFSEEKDRETVAEIIKRRLRGEQFEKIYQELKIKRKDGSTLNLLTFSKTIFYQGAYAGFVIFIDITPQKRLERLYLLLKETHRLIITSTLEEELYRKICKILVQKLGLRFVWVGVPHPESHLVKPLFHCGYERGYLKKVKISLDPRTPEGRGPTATALRKGRLILNPNTLTNPAMAPWKEEMLKRGYLSSCAIPLKKRGQTVAVLNLYAREPYYFEERTVEVLQELQKNLEFALRRLDENRKALIISKALEKSGEWVLVTDERGRILYANHVVCRLSGYRPQELLHKTPRIFHSGFQSRSFYKRLWEDLQAGREFTATFVNRKKSGELFYLHQTITPLELPGGAKRFIAVGRDITKEIQLGREIERFKYFDPITGLFNREGFASKVEEFLRFHSQPSALVLIDLRYLSLINQTYGLEVGNALLKAVAEELKSTLRPEDLLGKTGGDEFAIFLGYLGKKEDVFYVEKRLKDLFKKPFRARGQEIQVRINGGVALFPEDGQNFKELYERASVALHEAKSSGTNIIKFFSPDIERKATSFVRVESLLEKALKKKLALFFYQPYFRSSDLQIAGLEALLRLKDEKGRLLLPSEFIEQLEWSPYLEDLEKWALKEVACHIARWNLPVSLNLSARSFRSETFLKRLLQLPKKISRFLVIEVTERILIQNLERTREILKALKEREIKIAVDDFGTGYSCLTYLGELPLDIIKIDMSFTHTLLVDPKRRAIVETIVSLARALNLKTVAEGVETAEQLKALQELGCDLVQGFYLARPLPEEELGPFISGSAPQ